MTKILISLIPLGCMLAFALPAIINALNSWRFAT